ncbi:hypothetical protein ABLE91_05680 [Aquabacter sp. CN5-332]|uniref:hypothetical protein n=1 Tax=Aquabacter sp. CN5-332 TaxID=3156608 RepID=UPI0032B52C2D
MSISPAILDALLAAGATADMIVAAVKADAAQEEQRLMEKRGKDAERKRRSRSSAMSRGQDVTDADGRGQGVTAADTPHPEERKVSPDPSKETQPLPPTPSASPQALTPRGRAGDFETFWQAYPRKIGKDGAEKAFAKAIQRTPGLTVEAMVSALEAYRRFKPPDQDFCHPATWLNQGRWNDDWTGNCEADRGSGTLAFRGAAHSRAGGGSRVGISDPLIAAVGDLLHERSDGRGPEGIARRPGAYG